MDGWKISFLLNNQRLNTSWIVWAFKVNSKLRVSKINENPSKIYANKKEVIILLSDLALCLSEWVNVLDGWIFCLCHVHERKTFWQCHFFLRRLKSIVHDRLFIHFLLVRLLAISLQFIFPVCVVSFSSFCWNQKNFPKYHHLKHKSQIDSSTCWKHTMNTEH